MQMWIDLPHRCERTVGYLCFRRHVWKAQQWLGYVSSASSSSARLSNGGRLFRAKADMAFRDRTCLNPLAGRERRAVEETSLNGTERRYLSVEMTVVNTKCLNTSLDCHKSFAGLVCNSFGFVKDQQDRKFYQWSIEKTKNESIIKIKVSSLLLYLNTLFMHLSELKEKCPSWTPHLQIKDLLTFHKWDKR